MYARVTTYELERDAEDPIPSFGAAIDRIRGLPGLLDAYFLVDREGTRALTITLWATADAMEASRVAATRARSDAARDVGAEVTSTYEYAVRAHGSPEAESVTLSPVGGVR